MTWHGTVNSFTFTLKPAAVLKNTGSTLPLDKDKKTAVIGPLGDDQHDMLGPWWGQGRDADVVSVYDGILAQNPNTTFTKGCDTDNIDNAPGIQSHGISLHMRTQLSPCHAVYPNQTAISRLPAQGAAVLLSDRTLSHARAQSR